MYFMTLILRLTRTTVVHSKFLLTDQRDSFPTVIQNMQLFAQSVLINNKQNSCNEFLFRLTLKTCINMSYGNTSCFVGLRRAVDIFTSSPLNIHWMFGGRGWGLGKVKIWTLERGI